MRAGDDMPGAPRTHQARDATQARNLSGVSAGSRVAVPLTRIIVKGAREHNLKNIDVEIPRDKLVRHHRALGLRQVSLAFDTIYAEGQRRYVESLSAYARQFLGQMEKPDVDYIEGLSPAISIDQKGASRTRARPSAPSPRSTTTCACSSRASASPHCPQLRPPIERQTVQQIVDPILALAGGTRLMILAPSCADRKGEHQRGLRGLRDAPASSRVRVDGDRARPRRGDRRSTRRRSTPSRSSSTASSSDTATEAEAAALAARPTRVETALQLGEGLRDRVADADGKATESASSPSTSPARLRHLDSARSSRAPSPSTARTAPARTAPAWAPAGARPRAGRRRTTTCIAATARSLPWARAAARLRTGTRSLEAARRAVRVRHGHALAASCPKQSVDALLYGTDGEPSASATRPSSGRARHYETTFEGVVPNLERRYKETDSDYVRDGASSST